MSGELPPGDGFAVDPDSFAHFDQMRRGEETGLEAVMAENAFGEGASGSFALGSADVDDG